MTIILLFIIIILILFIHSKYYHKYYDDSIYQEIVNKFTKTNNNKTSLELENYKCFQWNNINLALRNQNNITECATIDGINCIHNCQDIYSTMIELDKPIKCDYCNLLDQPNHWCFQFKDERDDDIIYSGDVISLKGGYNNRYCSDDSRWMQCNSPIINVWEYFSIERDNRSGPIKDGDIVTLRGSRDNKYCSYNDKNEIRCDQITPSLWEKYVIVNNTNPNDFIKNNNKISFKSLKSQKYCSDTTNFRDFNKVIRCNSDIIDQNEIFTIIKQNIK